jgi:hypothetical protein
MNLVLSDAKNAIARMFVVMNKYTKLINSNVAIKNSGHKVRRLGKDKKKKHLFRDASKSHKLN